MNHPVIIESYYAKSKTFWIPIFDSEKRRSRYSAIVEFYRAPTHPVMKSWDKAQINIYDKKQNLIIFRYKRNYSYIPRPLYVRQKDKEYIITTGAYQCISICDLQERCMTDYVWPDDEAYENGDGFCPTAFDWKDNNLIIYGSLFNGPPQIMTIHDAHLDNLRFDNVTFKNNEEEILYE